MKKDLNEMKAKNEEILKRWRNLGLLRGLKEGSINEWRCAKSYEDLAIFFLNNEDSRFEGLAVVSFPFIRKTLCTGKKRLHRIIRPQEVLSFFENTTFENLYDFIKEEEINKSLHINFFRNLSQIEEFKDMVMIDFLKNEKSSKIKTVMQLFKDIIDVEAEVIVLCSDYFVYSNCKKNN